MRNIAIIPARSGSKGLKDKNIKLLNGVPLLAYTIKAAVESNMFNEIFVSTDSEVYAQIAREWGANVPFLRSAELSGDEVSAWDVVRDSIKRYEGLGKKFDTVALLQPTSPLRTSKDIINGYALMREKNAKSVVAVCEVDHSPLWCNTLPEDHSLNGFINESLLSIPRQKLPQYYRINGALYIVQTEYILTTDNIYQEKCYALIMDRENSVDIDDEIDFIIAETLISRHNIYN